MDEEHIPGFGSLPSNDGANTENILTTETVMPNTASFSNPIFKQQDSTSQHSKPREEIIDVPWRSVEDNSYKNPNIATLRLEVAPASSNIGWLEPTAEPPLIPTADQHGNASTPTSTSLELVPQRLQLPQTSEKNKAVTQTSSKPRGKQLARRKRRKKRKATSTAIERHVNDYIVTQGDLDNAKAWLERVENSKSQKQLTTSTQTQVEPLTALWAWLKGHTKTKTATKRKSDGSLWLDMAGELGTS
ncbi:MAG: hypothetical protein AAF267_24130, partial [Deinococcota bacterium]